MVPTKISHSRALSSCRRLVQDFQFSLGEIQSTDDGLERWEIHEKLAFPVYAGRRAPQNITRPLVVDAANGLYLGQSELLAIVVQFFSLAELDGILLLLVQ